MPYILRYTPWYGSTPLYLGKIPKRHVGYLPNTHTVSAAWRSSKLKTAQAMHGRVTEDWVERKRLEPETKLPCEPSKIYVIEEVPESAVDPKKP